MKLYINEDCLDSSQAEWPVAKLSGMDPKLKKTDENKKVSFHSIPSEKLLKAVQKCLSKKKPQPSASCAFELFEK